MSPVIEMYTEYWSLPGCNAMPLGRQ